jgi:hypothetical protein
MDFKEADQTEKAYQKQDGIFIGRKRVLGKKSKKVRKSADMIYRSSTWFHDSMPLMAACRRERTTVIWSTE